MSSSRRSRNYWTWWRRSQSGPAAVTPLSARYQVDLQNAVQVTETLSTAMGHSFLLADTLLLQELLTTTLHVGTPGGQTLQLQVADILMPQEQLTHYIPLHLQDTVLITEALSHRLTMAVALQEDVRAFLQEQLLLSGQAGVTLQAQVQDMLALMEALTLRQRHDVQLQETLTLTEMLDQTSRFADSLIGVLQDQIAVSMTLQNEWQERVAPPREGLHTALGAGNTYTQAIREDFPRLPDFEMGLDALPAPADPADEMIRFVVFTGAAGGAGTELYFARPPVYAYVGSVLGTLDFTTYEGAGALTRVRWLNSYAWIFNGTFLATGQTVPRLETAFLQSGVLEFSLFFLNRFGQRLEIGVISASAGSGFVRLFLNTPAQRAYRDNLGPHEPLLVVVARPGSIPPLRGLGELLAFAPRLLLAAVTLRETVSVTERVLIHDADSSDFHDHLAIRETPGVSLQSGVAVADRVSVTDHLAQIALHRPRTETTVFHADVLIQTVLYLQLIRPRALNRHPLNRATLN